MSLQDELKKRNPFESAKHEAMLSILRTSDLLENRVARVLREHQVTPSQYNVLRILRGEGRPMQTIEIAKRMIQVAPAITRVIEQLQKVGLIKREQSPDDGRVFLIQLTAKAEKLLHAMDHPVNEIHETLMVGLNDAELQQLIALLNRLRAGIPT